MKKIIYLAAILFITGILASCEKEKEFLGTLPRGQVIAKSTADFRKLLDFVDNSRYSYSLSKTTWYLDIVTDDCYMDSTKWNTYTTTKEHLKNLYAYKKNVYTL